MTLCFLILLLVVDSSHRSRHWGCVNPAYWWFYSLWYLVVNNHIMSWRFQIPTLEGELYQQIPLSRKEHHFLLLWRYGSQISIKDHRQVIPGLACLLFICILTCNSLNCVLIVTYLFNHLPCCHPDTVSELSASDMNWAIIRFNLPLSTSAHCYATFMHTWGYSFTHRHTHTRFPPSSGP